ncbi:MAG: sn-glycerol-3-phosphate ABC transporter ATP-binding protein UgpC [Actinomycetota bacterium]|nr:sn-glycerol-3-phosphate ABC transporter ATP-binding protein UgpC [Actinomycetota bacterium]
MTKQVRFDDVSLVYPGGQSPAVAHLDLTIAEGEFLVLVGPSGCGKSTSLRMLAGLEPISSGKIYIGDRDVTNVPAKDRDIAMVFQNYALYPHMSVAENMAFALKIQKVSKDEINRRVKEAAALLDLTDYLERKPKALSGGQRQRVAMGRAIVREPEVFLMDEPLSNLDAKLRVQTRTQIAALQRRLGTTTVYVTHDQVEAMTMGDRVAVLKGGILQQCASPRELYDDPANAFVGTFIGSPSMNIIPGPLTEHGVNLNGFAVPVERSVMDKAASGQVLLGVRPEDLEIATEGAEMTVTLVEELGADTYVYGTFKAVDGSNVDLVARGQGMLAPKIGTVVRVRPTRTYIFDTEGAQLRLS